MVDFVELNLWEPLKNFHWNLFRRLSNAVFINFLLKANQQFVEIPPTTYIFQSRSIYNITGNVVWSGHDQEALYWYVNRSQPCFPQLQKYSSKQYDFQSIEANVLEVIKSRKLQHVRRSYKHEAFNWK